MDTIDTYIAISEHVSQYGVFSLCFLNIMLVLGIFEMHVLITTLKTICQKSVKNLSNYIFTIATETHLQSFFDLPRKQRKKTGLNIN